MTLSTLAPTLTLRHPTPEDAQKVFELLVACDMDYVGYPDSDMQDLLNDWADFALNSDAWVVTTPDGKIVGYEILFNDGDGDFAGDGYVHPEFRNQGIGTVMLEALENRVREIMPPTGSVYVRCYTIEKPTDSAFFLGNGYHVKKYTFRMRIDMTEAPAAPVWPDGLRVRNLNPDNADYEAKAAWRVIQDAFYKPDRAEEPFENWKHNVIDRLGFEHWMFNVAVNEADEIVGVVSLRYYPGDHGWIWQVAVNKDYRKQGLGMAFLKHAFGIFWNLGEKAVKLGVDAQNPTGAVRLYQSAGMQQEEQFVQYEKIVRDA